MQRLVVVRTKHLPVCACRWGIGEGDRDRPGPSLPVPGRPRSSARPGRAPYRENKGIRSALGSLTHTRATAEPELLEPTETELMPIHQSREKGAPKAKKALDPLPACLGLRGGEGRARPNPPARVLAS